MGEAPAAWRLERFAEHFESWIARGSRYGPPLARRLLDLDSSFDPQQDPFFSDRDFYTGPTPPDLVKNLDEYLYGSDD